MRHMYRTAAFVDLKIISETRPQMDRILTEWTEF